MARHRATTATIARLKSDSTEFGLPRREFLLLWVSVSALTPVVSYLLSLAASAGGIDLGLIEYPLTLAMFSLPQWFVLKRYLLHFSALEWLWRSALGWLSGLIGAAVALAGIASLGSVQPGAVKAATENQVIVSVTLVVAGLLLGLTVGLALWPMLKRYAPGQTWQFWAAANSISFGLGAALHQLATLLGYSGPIKDILSLFIEGLSSGLVTGYALLKILHQPASLQKPAPTYVPKPNNKRPRK